ncbi:hypothetical protein PsAD46_01124 [Pseudovibrio sp. Ad46]|uniref:TadE/TadG family type IV pilus assembly protein n=1 Tax=unclassified Pseudovibrio TaxID=2627060 RepID=UPI0007B2AAD5|nr:MULTISPECIES: TadE/TadG family type IV pilus assembly protein [unclassified Pseudovibrio]KZK93876.1 hypothetical protein PsAD46_01124 [Pseudovibrio sp. Ad46]KZL00090.1 hypothetical protein PsAD5_01134 [Pseudovibrio sp. Ad5]
MSSYLSFFRKLRCFLFSETGVAAIEFAIVLPLLLFLFIGMVELTTALSFDRRVSKTGASIGDLVARADNVSNDMDDIERAIELQMTPFEDADINVRIGMVQIRQDRPQVVWSWGNNTDEPWARGSKPTGVFFSDAMLINGQFYVVSSARLEYDFLLGSVLSDLGRLLSGDSEKLASISLSDSFILLPRRVSCVEYDDHCANWPPS